ncbi:hypothetical protein AB1E18_000399 [Capra hircus]
MVQFPCLELYWLSTYTNVEAASIGFVIVIDRRRDKWSSIKASLTRIAVAFPGNLQLIFILRPSRFIQRTFTDIGIKYYRDEFKMKVPIVMLNSISDLHDYIDKSQLTADLGGTLEYCHSQWINHRTAIENFALALKTTAQMLQTFGACLAITELPRSIPSTEDLLMSHMRQRNKLQDELKLLGKQGATLLSCMQESATKSPTSKLSLNEVENVTTMERLLVQLDETEKAFSQFWSEHHLKLNEYLQLQHFEHSFCEVKLALDNLLAEQAEFSDFGDSVMHVEQLLKEHKKLEGEGQESLEKAQLLAVIGDQLIQSHHYAVDFIRPRCAELRHLCDDFINENKKKHDILEKSLELHRRLDKVSQWCEAGVYLLASQAVDKCQSREGVDIALNDIETFLGTAKEYQLPSSKDFYNQYELMLTLDIKNEEILESSYDADNPEPEQPDSSKNLSPSRTFLKELEKCTENPELLAHCFLKRKEDLQIYFKYHKNLPRARAIWQECQDCTYFGVCQRQLGHSLPLFKCLREPSQRLIKYQMLLKGLLDFESPEDLEMDPSHLEGGSAKDDIGKFGKLLMHGSFNVWTVHKDRYKMKDLIRFKPSQRQIYLFERGIVFCKIQMEPSDQGLSPHYSFKKSMKLMTLSIRQLGRGSNRKFEIANQNGLEKYILQAASKEIRDCWFSEISKLLMKQQNNIKGCSSREFVSVETSVSCEGAEDLEKESSVLSLSGLFQLDNSYETSKSGQEKGESIRGQKEGCQKEDTATSKTESLGMSTGLLAPAGKAGFPQAEAVGAQEGSLRPPSAEN